MTVSGEAISQHVRGGVGGWGGVGSKLNKCDHIKAGYNDRHEAFQRQRTDSR